MDLSDKKIIVTGAAHGIGASAVRAYVKAGAEVVGMDIDAARGFEVAARACEVGPGTAHFVKCDVGNRQNVDAAFDLAVARMGRLDVLAHIAGVHRLAPTHDVSDETLHWLFNINVNGTIYTNGAAYRHMAQGGAIVNCGSESGLTAEPNNAVYGASKAAVHTWTRSVAREWARKGIRVNAVLPLMDTSMMDRYRETLSVEELAIHDALLAEQIPLGGKLGNADIDLAPVLIFLASEGARFITGQLIPVDGGLISVR